MFYRALERAPQLERLSISGECFTQPWGAQGGELPEILQLMKMFGDTVISHPGLQHFQISGYIWRHLTGVIVEIIRSSKLKSLSIRSAHDQFYTDGKALRDALAVSSLKKLEAMGWDSEIIACNIPDDTKLEELVLGSPIPMNENDPHNREIEDNQAHNSVSCRVMENLGESLRGCKQLRYLDIRRLSGRGDDYATVQLALVNVLATLPHLKELGLRTSGTLPDKLFAAVLTLPRLETLHLLATVNKADSSEQNYWNNVHLSDLYGIAIQQIGNVRNNVAPGSNFKRLYLAGDLLDPSTYITVREQKDDLELWFKRVVSRHLPDVTARLVLEWRKKSAIRGSKIAEVGNRLTLIAPAC
jgi:hypothetical protein